MIMAGFGFLLKFWTMQQNNVSEKDITVHQYYGKDAVTNGEYHNLKRQFVVNRNELWMPRNRGSTKLRESIKIFEEILTSNHLINVEWNYPDLIQVVFSSGMIANIQLTVSNDIEKITFEKSLINKVTSLSSGFLLGQFVYFSTDNQSKLTFIALKHPGQLNSVDIPGPKDRVQRHMCTNANKELLVCWWQYGAWLQTIQTDNERKNIALLRCSFGRLEVMDSILSENDLLQVEFSKTNPIQLLTLEKPDGDRNDKSFHSVIYECSGNEMLRLKVVTLPVRSGILSFARNSTEDKLVVGCSDGFTILYDLTMEQVTAKITQRNFVPTLVTWIGPLILVGSGQGELKLFDSLLQPLFFYDQQEKEFLQLEVSKHLTSGNGLMKMLAGTQNNILLVFNGGPFAMLNLQGHLDTLVVLKQHLKTNKETEAVKLLCSLNWNYESEKVYLGLLTAVDHLLRKQLNYDREVQLEGALSAFYASKTKISDSIVIKYRTTIGFYARRFFHQLLRFQRFEKAFLLAKDIAAADLFLDIYFAAKDVGEMHLAQLAKTKADEIIAADATENDFLKTIGKFPDINDDKIVPDASNRDYLANALNRDERFFNNESSSSTLKVTNLGYV